MIDHHTVHLIERAQEEIISLRASLANAQTKAQAYDVIAGILDLRNIGNSHSMGYSEDIVGRLRKKAEELSEKPKEPVLMDEDAAFDEAFAEVEQAARPRPVYRTCECGVGPCPHDPLNRRITSAAKPTDGSDGDE